MSPPTRSGRAPSVGGPSAPAGARLASDARVAGRKCLGEASRRRSAARMRAVTASPPSGRDRRVRDALADGRRHLRGRRAAAEIARMQ
ncbi:hypothetical protein FCJ60_04725 [Burkholderia metallica]|nr:hypothetical protein [Burkholderia metallica]